MKRKKQKSVIPKKPSFVFTPPLEREDLLDAALEDQSETVNEINAELIQYNILKREVDSNKQVYDGLLNRLKEAGILAGLSASNIRIVDRAEPSGGPISPRKNRNLFLGLMVGLMSGLGLVFFQEYMDDSIKSPRDISRYLKVPTIGILPQRETLARKESYGHYRNLAKSSAGSQEALDLVSFESPNSLMAEAYRSMRTSLLLSAPDHPPQTVLVTSALPSEGKTVTATNLAISLAQTGARVALVDADLRKPRIHSVFALGATPGLSALLTGSASLKDVLHEVSIPNLFVLPAGLIPPNPAELLLSERCRDMTSALREYFDYVVFDSPPISNVSEARILSPQMDSTLLVILAGSTSKRAVESALDRLLSSHARVGGAVLNGLDMRVEGYDPYYYSGQYYYASGSSAKS